MSVSLIAPSSIPAACLPRNASGTRAWLTLARSRNVGGTSFRSLIKRFRSAEAALDALPDLRARGGRGGYDIADPAAIDQELELAEAAGARMLCLGAPGYPSALATIPDAPPLIWARGDPSRATEHALAIVGARNASAAGLRIARMLAEGLGGDGYTTVSGLARGIDTVVHQATLSTGTIAVLAGGVDQVYPAENSELAEAVAAEGLLISEAPMGVAPQARHFPRRNRLISGLARAVVLVEAAGRSGSLITAQYALEQGRDVMAVPGSPLDPRVAGCNRLIRDGAALIRSVEDVIDALDAPRQLPLHFEEPADDWPNEAGMVTLDSPTSSSPVVNLTSRIMSYVSNTPVAEDELIRLCQAPVAEVLQTLVELDIAGQICRQPGGTVTIAA